MVANYKWLKLSSKKLSVATAHEDENLMAQNIIFNIYTTANLSRAHNYCNNNINIDTRYCSQHNNDHNRMVTNEREQKTMNNTLQCYSPNKRRFNSTLSFIGRGRVSISLVLFSQVDNFSRHRF